MQTNFNTKLFVADVRDLDNDALFKHYYNLMPRDRQKKIDTYLFKKDKKLSLGVGILLMLALDKMGLDINNLNFVEKHNKKPYIKNQKIFFNLSHSEDKVLCAIASSEIGCDIEKIQDIDLMIAKRFFYNEEYELLLSQSVQEKQNDLFYRLWTLKESFMKITGLGFHLPLNKFCILFDGDQIGVRQNLNSKKYFFNEFNIFNDYKIACCCENNLPCEINIVDIKKEGRN